MSRTAIAMLFMVGLWTSPALAAPMGAHAMSPAALVPDAVPNATGHLVYNGGPVLQNVKVVTVYWGNNVQFSGTGAQSLDAFYKAVIASPYYDWLIEYNTTSPVQKFGRGTFGGTYAYTNGATGTLQDSSIQTALGGLIDQGKVPAPDANTLYAIHFAPGINIKMSDGSASCQVFCAYHSSFVHGTKNVYYAINPDQGGACAGGCGNDPSTFNNTTSVASHELVEATTDANVGSNSQSQLAWYDNTNGEIGDICNASQCSTTAASTSMTKCPTMYVVQNEWSNKNGKCMSQDPSIVVNDFSVGANPSTAINVPQGGMTTVMVSLTKTAGNADPTVALSATAPTNVTASFSPTSVSSDAGKSTLTISATAMAMLGSGKVTITAAGSNSSTHSMDLMINVVPPPDMAMSPDLATPSGGGSGGNGGGGNGGSGGGTGTGGNGNGGNGGGGGGDSGCSIGGGSIAGSWAFAGLVLLALAFRRRRA